MLVKTENKLLHPACIIIILMLLYIFRNQQSQKQPLSNQRLRQGAFNSSRGQWTTSHSFWESIRSCKRTSRCKSDRFLRRAKKNLPSKSLFAITRAFFRVRRLVKEPRYALLFHTIPECYSELSACRHKMRRRCIFCPCFYADVTFYFTVAMTRSKSYNLRFGLIKEFLNCTGDLSHCPGEILVRFVSASVLQQPRSKSCRKSPSSSIAKDRIERLFLVKIVFGGTF